MNLQRTITLSFEILFSHKVRTILSGSAVFVGVAAVVLMGGAGLAAKEDLMAKVQGMGSRVLMIQAGQFEAVGTRQIQVVACNSLTTKDAQLLRTRIPGVVAVSGVVREDEVAVFGRNKVLASVEGVDASFFTMQKIPIGRGRTFTQEDEAALVRVAIVSDPRGDLFGWFDPLGQTFRLEGAPFRVVGIVANRAISKISPDEGTMVYLPLGTAMTRVLGTSSLSGICLQAQDESSLNSLPRYIGPILRKSHRLPHGKPDDFTIQDPVALLKAEHDMGRSFKVFVGALAAISLFTGGVGILVVMLLSVRERTSEIGLRRSLGARKRDVALQFLLEAALLSGLGGTGGILAGLAGNVLVCHIERWPLVWPMVVSLGAWCLSVSLGVASGLLPAIRAARLDPARALTTA